MSARRIGRLGILAVGLGIGAAVASTPGIAAADTPADPFPFSSINLGDLFPAADAAPSSPLDLDISVDGHMLLDLGSSATATSGTGDIAIAYGADSTAIADGGFGDYALATAETHAIAGDFTPGATGNNFDFASASGDASYAYAGNTGLDTTGSSFDYASASSEGASDTEGATALAGFDGSGDSATAVGQSTSAQAGVGAGSSGTPTPANFDSAIVLGNLTTPTTPGDAGFAVGGSNDTAFVVDPLGTVGSTAVAGNPGFNFDLAGVFGDALQATANTAGNLVDILPSL
jgi:hypothetical protein